MKIDTTKIPGFENMSPEQKTAITSMEFPDPADYSGYVKKDLYDKAASEAAGWKKKHNDLLSEEEKNKQEKEEAYKNLLTEVEALRRDKTVSAYTAKYIAQGYSEALARDTATAMVEGNMDKFFKNQENFIAAHSESIKKELLKGTPRTPAGDGSAGIDYHKRIAEANERGDFATVAALIRKQQENEQK